MMKMQLGVKRKTTLRYGDVLGDQHDAKMKQGNGGHAVVFMQDCTWFLTFEQQLLFLLLETFTF